MNNTFQGFLPSFVLVFNTIYIFICINLSLFLFQDS